MRRTLLAVLVVAAAVTLWWTSDRPGIAGPVDPDVSKRRDEDPAGAPLRSAPESTLAQRRPLTEGQPETSRQNADPAEKAAAAFVDIVGRCVDEAGQPVAGVVLGVQLDWDAIMPDERAAARRIVLPEPVMSDALGGFVIRVPRTRLSLAMVAKAPWYLQSSLFDLGSEPRSEVGDLVVERGWPVRGSVVNHRGEPVPWARLKIEDRICEVRDGRFDLGSQPAGEKQLSCDSGGYGLVAPRMLRVGPGIDGTEVRVVLNEFPAVTGVLLDESGQPVAKRQLWATVYPNGVVGAVTDDRGRFRLSTGTMEPAFLRLGPEDGFDEEGFVEQTEWLRSPCTGVILRWRAWPEFLLRILGPNGLPVTDGAIRSKNFGILRQVGRGPDGVTRWKGLPPGLQRCAIRLADGTQFGEWFEIDASRWERVAREIRLPRMARLSVTLTGAEDLVRKASVTFVPKPLPADGNPYQSCSPDADGVVHLDVPTELAGQAVHVAAGGVHQRVPLHESHERTREIEVALKTPGSRAHGRVVLQPSPAMRLVGADQLSQWITARSAATGEKRECHGFEISGLAAGAWDILYQTAGRGWSAASGRSGVDREDRVLGRVLLGAGETRSLRLDVPEAAPGRLRGVALHRGKPVPHADLWAACPDRHWWGRARTDGAGRFDFGWLPQGAYRVRAQGLAVPGVTEERDWTFAKPVVVRAGVEDPVRIETVSRALVVRVREEDGSLVANRWFDVRGFGPVQSDAAGVLRLDPPPPGEVRMTSRAVPGRGERTAVVRPDGGRVVTVRLRRD